MNLLQRVYIFSIFLFFVSISLTSSINAQSTATSDNAINPNAKNGLTSCFDYYKFGSVQVNVGASIKTATAGSLITFSGKIQNENAYPIVNGRVYVKIFRKQEGAVNIKKNGHNVVDEFIAQEGISIEGKQTKDISIEWKIPAHMPSGEYQLATYFITDKKFNLSGLSFTDDVTGNTANFSVSGYIKDIAYLDKNSVTVNGNPYLFATPIPKFNKEVGITAKAILKNDSKEDVIMPVTWTLYAWDAQSEKNKIEEKKVDYIVSAGRTQNVEYTITDTKNPVYLLIAKASYKDTYSILNIRVGRGGVEGIRLNFPSTATYPLVKGEEATVFSCFHSMMTDVVKDGKLELTTEGLSGNVLHSYIYTGDITGSMMAVKDMFTPTKTLDNFVVRAKLYKGNTLIDESEVRYCKDTDEFGKCPAGLASMSNQTKTLIGGGAVVLILIALFYLLKTKKNEEIPA